jgi:hypothetical protein
MIRRLWPLLVGFAIWGVAFNALYALQYLGCHFSWAPATHRIALIAGYAVFVALLAGTLAFQFARVRKTVNAATLMDQIGIGATAAALAATAFNFAPTLLASACI